MKPGQPFLKLFILILAVSVLTAGEGKPAIGESAPGFYLRDLQGQSYFLSKLIAEENPLLISFFATWCAPCRQEIPAYEALLKNPDYEKVQALYVHVGEPSAKPGKGKADFGLLDDMIEELSMTYPVLLDKYAVAAGKYGATSLPTTVIIDQDGDIAYYHTGFQSGDEQKVATVLQDILNQSSE